MLYKRVVAALLLLMLCQTAFAQRQPSWIKKLPTPENGTYYYVHTSATDRSVQQARQQATYEIFERAAQRMGVAFDIAEISKALQNGQDASVISQFYNIPINVVCNYNREVKGGVEVHLLAQVAVAGNISVQFTPFSRCQEHLSDVSKVHSHCIECDKINRNNDFYSSYGEGVTYTEAVATAKSILSEQVDWLSVGGMDIDVIELSPEPECRVFVYVAKSKVKSVVEERRKLVQDYVFSGRNCEQNLQINDALRNYYLALMLAKSLPETVEVDFENRSGNATVLLPDKIRSVLMALSCEVVDMEEDSYGEFIATLSFSYAGHPVASLTCKYFNGSYMKGPLTVKDGRGEVVLEKLPSDNKIAINYEYRFAEEARAILPEVFENAEPVTFAEASQWCDIKGKAKRSDRKRKPKPTQAEDLATEQIETIETVTRTQATDTKPYERAMAVIAEAIKQQDAKRASVYMTPDCYALFVRLLTQSRKLTLAKQDRYEFLSANDGEIRGQYMKVNLTTKGGRTFTDKLVFRFSSVDQKVHSFAFGLTERAEQDIFDAEKRWESVSRWTILGFMEDYQTAFALKRMDYLENVFSDDALIIVGRELRRDERRHSDRLEGRLDEDGKYVYERRTKREYLEKLRKVFANDDIHLTFEENLSMMLDTHGKAPQGTVFGIRLKQHHNSRSYSDVGYLTLMLRMDQEYPIIVVRYWDPNPKGAPEKLGTFFSDNFEW